jgi:predicted  nucleic acid-binding Zn-ribbon protein
MKICQNCGQVIANDASFCPRCGHNQSSYATSNIPRKLEREAVVEREQKIKEYYKIARDRINLELRYQALNELARLGARDELMKIASNPMMRGKIRERALELLKTT